MKENSRDVKFMLMLTSTEKKMWEEFAKMKGISVSAFVRDSCNGKTIKRNSFSEFDRLIGKEVYAQIDDDLTIYGKVLSVRIEDYYFYHKNESISVLVTLEPPQEEPDNYDFEDYIDIPLELIHLV